MVVTQNLQSVSLNLSSSWSCMEQNKLKPNADNTFANALARKSAAAKLTISRPYDDHSVIIYG